MGRQAINFGCVMKRSTWSSIAVGTLFNIAFCFVVAWVFSPIEPGSGFLILLATVWGVGLLIHLKARLVKALIYYLGGKQQRIEATLDELVSLRMPAGSPIRMLLPNTLARLPMTRTKAKMRDFMLRQ